MFASNYLSQVLANHYRTPGLKRLLCRHWVRKHCFRRLACHYRHEIIPTHLPRCANNERGIACMFDKQGGCIFKHDGAEGDVPMQPNFSGNNSTAPSVERIIKFHKETLSAKASALLKSKLCLVNPIDVPLYSAVNSFLYNESDQAKAKEWHQVIMQGESVSTPTNFAILDL